MKAKANIIIHPTRCKGAAMLRPLLRADDDERWPVPVKSCRQAVPGLS
jgi:hypothetical protein